MNDHDYDRLLSLITTRCNKRRTLPRFRHNNLKAVLWPSEQSLGVPRTLHTPFECTRPSERCANCLAPEMGYKVYVYSSNGNETPNILLFT